MKELDQTNYPEFLEKMLSFDLDPEPPRAYPGYPRLELPKTRRAFLGQRVSLERALANRRRPERLPSELLDAKTLAYLLTTAHGVTAACGRGPTPSAGGLQALELYLISMQEGWLAPGGYHYGRASHSLTRHFEGAGRAAVEREWVPSLSTVSGGSLLFVLVGDVARVEAKYSFRALQFLFLEAGHLMQSLCLLAPIVPLGAFFERPLAKAFHLPSSDRVLYVGVS